MKKEKSYYPSFKFINLIINTDRFKKSKKSGKKKKFSDNFKNANYEFVFKKTE